MARAAGNMAQLMAKENDMALLRLPSGELRNVPVNCMATVGQVGNADHENVKIGKAGRKRQHGLETYRPRFCYEPHATTPTAVVRVNPLSAVRDRLPPGASPLWDTRPERTITAPISLS